MWFSLVRRFLLFAFSFSWGAWLLAYWLRRDALYIHLGAWDFQLPLYHVFVLLGLFGPGLAALWLVGEREDDASVWARLKNWRVDPSWYSIAFFLPIGLVAISALAFARTGGNLQVRTAVGSSLLYFLLQLLLGPFWEELGWRGFLLPVLLQRQRPMRASLILGLIWGIWHLPLRWGETHVSVLAFLGFFLIFCTMTMGLSVIISWIFLRTNGALLPVIVLHASHNFVAQKLSEPAPRLAGMSFVIWFTASIWAAALVVNRLGGLRGPSSTSHP